MVSRRRPVTGVVMARMTRRRPKTYTTTGSRRMGVRSQGIHVTGFAADLQLVLDEGIMRTGLVGRRMMGTTLLEWTPTKRTTTRWWSPTTGRRSSTSWTTTALATAAVV